MRRDCSDVEALLDRRAADLADSERLVLARHLSECADCGQTVRALGRVVQELEAAPSLLSDAARERAIAGAFARASAPRATAARGRTRTNVGLALAAAAALLLCVRWAVREDAQQTAPLARSTPAPAAHVPDVEAPTPSPIWIEATAPERRQFAHAAVQLAAGTRLRFDAAAATLELAQGEVDVDVDPRAGRPFAVLTSSFRVEVLGTQFVVTPDEVRVARGRVRVLDREGRVLREQLAAGDRYVREAALPAAEPAMRRAPRAKERARSGELVLAEARAALADGDARAARGLLDEASRARLSRREQAEAHTLRAECALLEGDMPRVLALYLEIAERFGELPAGENAAFAAAQLSPRVAPARTGALLQRYLARYPEGRFADEARARLARTGAER